MLPQSSITASSTPSCPDTAALGKGQQLEKQSSPCFQVTQAEPKHMNHSRLPQSLTCLDCTGKKTSNIRTEQPENPDMFISSSIRSTVRGKQKKNKKKHCLNEKDQI